MAREPSRLDWECEVSAVPGKRNRDTEGLRDVERKIAALTAS